MLDATLPDRSCPAVVKARPEAGGLELADMPLAPVGPCDALINIRYAAICGTDLHLYKWNRWAERNYRPPFPLGHEFCGEILEVGSQVTDFQPGDLVSAETHIYCGHCAQCRMNRRHTCLNLQLFSRLGQGCFRRYAVVPARALRKVPAGIAPRHAAIMEPLGVSIRAVMESDVREANLLVVGCGPIGLFAVAAASALGAARISAIDPVSFRSNLAQSVGAHITASSINELDGGLCGVGDADIVIESSGHPGAIRSALEAIRPGGEFIIAGLPDEEISVDISRHIVLREVHLRGIYGRLIDETWITVERFLQQNAVRIDPILTHEFPLEAFEAAFSAAASGRVGKVLFEIAG